MQLLPPAETPQDEARDRQIVAILVAGLAYQPSTQGKPAAWFRREIALGEAASTTFNHITPEEA